MEKQTYYMVIRKAVLPEDEGREHYLGKFHTKQGAKNRIKGECDDGYFSPGDFDIVEWRYK